MYGVRRICALIALVLAVVTISYVVPKALDPTIRSPEKRARDRLWVNSSPYFIDRQLCRWASLCGLHHLRRDPASRNFAWEEYYKNDRIGGELKKRSTDWEEDAPREDKKRNIHERRKVLKDIPDYVKNYAPLVHLYSGEEFWPSDIKEHVQHMTVYVNGEPQNVTDEPWSLDNLHLLNEMPGNIILRSNDDVERRPAWLHSHVNVPKPFQHHNPEDGGHGPSRGPDGNGSPINREPTTWYDVDKNHPLHRISDPRKHDQRHLGFSDAQQAKHIVSRGYKPDSDGYSRAPAVLVLVDKGSGILDAFWFFFYSYNLGQTVLGLRFGNHVGDWEHCMVRFQDGIPRGVFFSEHEGGQAYAWEAVEKSSTGRPIIYSAVGSHAMYPLPGPHAYILPFGLLKDVTDKGPLWDPSLNNYAYHYDYTLENPEDVVHDDATPSYTPFHGHDRKKKKQKKKHPGSLTPAASNPKAPTSWFHFRGRWGDEVYSLADLRQWRLFGQYHYVTGPDGPKYKSLNRSKLCQTKKCNIAYELDPDGKWY